MDIAKLYRCTLAKADDITHYLRGINELLFSHCDIYACRTEVVSFEDRVLNQIYDCDVE